MKETQNYFLNGIYAGQSRQLVFTCKGIEVQDDEVISIYIFIDMFIDNVLHFANYPKREIEVIKI